MISIGNTSSAVFNLNNKYILYNEDCLQGLKRIPDNTFNLIITSPPYFMGKEYDRSKNIDDFYEFHQRLLPEIIRVTKFSGSICWQVGYHVKNGIVVPLDYFIYEIMKKHKEMFLRNRIIWTYGHGLHNKKRFSGRHETILWFTKGKEYYFDLDSVRIPQKYPGKKHYKGKKIGEYSCNPLGKNPSDVWEIPNVKSNHIEKTNHPCQFPIALVQRLINSLVPRNGLILDPFVGSGSSGVASILEGKRFVGFEINRRYYKIAQERCKSAVDNVIQYRPIEKPIFLPSKNLAIVNNPFTNGRI